MLLPWKKHVTSGWTTHERLKEIEVKARKLLRKRDMRVILGLKLCVIP